MICRVLRELLLSDLSFPLGLMSHLLGSAMRGSRRLVNKKWPK